MLDKLYSTKVPLFENMNEEQRKKTNRTKILSQTLSALTTLISMIIFMYVIYFGYLLFIGRVSLEKSEKLDRSEVLAEKNFLSNAAAIEYYATKFERYMEKFGRHYKAKEQMRRFKIYTQNMMEIERINERNKRFGVEFGENEFSDWTDEEFQKMLLPKNFYKKRRETAKFIKTVPKLEKLEGNEAIPDHFDWRNYKYNVVTPVKNQNGCGSCWAFATVGTVESAYAIGHGELRSLSEQELLDCNLENNACDGGDVDKALKFVYDHGLMTEDDYPYVAHRQNACLIHGNTTKIKVAYFLHQDEANIIDWLIHYGPVNVGINVTGDMKAYKGGVYTPDKWECENEIIGTHAINIVGYGTDSETNQKYWIVKNSWGDDWGIENGYVYFARGINSCGIEDEPVGVLA